MIKIQIRNLFPHERCIAEYAREINSAQRTVSRLRHKRNLFNRHRANEVQQDQDSQSTLYAGHVHDMYGRARGDMRVYYPRKGRDFLRYSTFVFLRSAIVSCMTMSSVHVFASCRIVGGLLENQLHVRWIIQFARGNTWGAPRGKGTRQGCEGIVEGCVEPTLEPGRPGRTHSTRIDASHPGNVMIEREAWPSSYSWPPRHAIPFRTYRMNSLFIYPIYTALCMPKIASS